MRYVPAKNKKESTPKAPDEYVMEFVNQSGPRTSVTHDVCEITGRLAQDTGLSIRRGPSCLLLVSERPGDKPWSIFEISEEEGRGVVVLFFGCRSLLATDQRTIIQNVENALEYFSADFEITGKADSITVLKRK